ncbi:diguanylate cyclase (GGDEF)-like protein/PAS domain S-box-containing protein [Acidovorax delafieldii]|uniref:Diguanylate cyclase (GGDEF)-like protein/PAS domain S-box-containing protein n=1 Tax=Acidovorax delafieldii TaxID=47920 RepID=A0AAJ2BNY4_ACIDE|nr:GGDEF and EAL domain-containing protein [Acidovorax delafieldii]MDR6765667.1 diguanylate cyclase (GGDEF)-like protein/PAS domain S-box-containing protein [Acidovorax delafieldii]MDR6836104.1 diguanylate cyclase (GGDEF)-like protein/PAS domain S-box-containing protein [Acidovorax delafieldii]MDR7364925.1 diguanylate cyclase (GGDEF)-like protein/PAS domain S-box-containing protein [Acidovorax delafieldii]
MQDRPHAAPAPGPSGSSDALLRLIADSVPALMAYYDLPGLRCQFANQGYAAYNGHSTESILGLTVQEAIGDKAWQAIQPHVDRCSHGERVKYTREQTLPNGDVRMIEVNLIPHFDGAGQQLGSFVLITDITERWRAEREVRQSEERMRKFTEATDEAIVFHRDGLITDGNEALTRLTGYSLQEVTGLSIFNFISPEWRATALEYTRSGREDPYEVTICHKDGHAIPVEVVGKTMPLHHADYRIVVVRDITARKQAQEREAFIALHDTLTQLPNRHFLMEQLSQVLSLARRRHGRVAVLFMNLDHFKTVNDSLGHHAGDQLLRNVAERLRNGVRDADVVARLGGDEFVVVLTDIQTPDDAAMVADKLLDSMHGVFTVDHLPLTISPSIGISLFPDHGASADVLLRCADAAMQHAKESGRGNRQFYATSMDASALDVLHQERLLRDAIARNDFELHYQPQIHLADGTLQGLEALVRWRHPERGLVGPDEFITFSESRGLITPIGRWVMREACRQLKAWQDEGLAPVPVAVNLSALEFRQRDVAAEIASVLLETGLAPQYLEIELTESVLMHQTGQVLDTLNAIKALGVGISIDDFGTGYSSLAYLKRYPIDKLKIDRSFVADTPGNTDDVAIVTAIIQMGRSLQLQTVAEGVETQAQIDLLAGLGCDLIQGFVVAMPMGEESTRRWLLRNKTK